MSNLNQFYGGGGIRPTGLINGASELKYIYTTLIGAYALLPGVKAVSPGAVTAATLKTVLSLSGKGAIAFLGVHHADNVSKSHRLKVTLDGVVIFDATSPVLPNGSYHCTAIGTLMVFDQTLGGGGIVPDPLLFNSSLLIEYASSITETNGAEIAYRYYPR